MSSKTRVIHYGLGPIGSGAARYVMDHAGLELVGGVDIDATKVGKDIGDVIGLGRSLAIPVVEKLADALERRDADVVLHATSSCFDAFMPELIEIVEAGLDIVSTAEELTFPWLAHPHEAAEVDEVAKRVGRTVLGTGVNPGFIMDSLPLNLTAICQRVDRIEVRRVIDASARRGPFQAKIGCGMTVEDFEAKMAGGRMGHVGLPESLAMVFHTLGKELAHYESTVEPMVADRSVNTAYFEVQPGHVKGLKQVARGYTKESEFMSLTFVATLEAADDGDTIRISGKPDLEVKLQGTNGDVATSAIVVNAIRRAREAPAGLLTMADLPIVTIW